MKIKELCRRTGLTERTVRYYTQRGLLSPAAEERNGRLFREYGEADVRGLSRAAALRRAGFSIEDILLMRQEPKRTGELLRLRRAEASAAAEENAARAALLETVSGPDALCPDRLADRLLQAAAISELPRTDVEPDFSRFDPETAEEKAGAARAFERRALVRERRERRLRPLWRVTACVCAAAVLFVAVVLLSGIPRNIHRTYDAYRLSLSDASVGEAVSVTVDGRLQTRWFSPPVFEGEIRIEGRAYTGEAPVTLTFFDGMGESAWLLYHTLTRQGEDVLPGLVSTAIVWTDRRFSELIFQLYEPEGEAESKVLSDTVLCAPAGSREEGLSLLEARGLTERIAAYAQDSAQAG